MLSERSLLWWPCSYVWILWVRTLADLTERRTLVQASFIMLFAFFSFLLFSPFLRPVLFYLIVPRIFFSYNVMEVKQKPRVTESYPTLQRMSLVSCLASFSWCFSHFQDIKHFQRKKPHPRLQALLYTS